MRLWPALLLLVSCSRPNPLFFDGGASGDMSSGTLDLTTGTTTSGAVDLTTSEVTTTGSTTTTSGGDVSTGSVGPLCEPFPDQRLVVDPPLPAAQCAAVTQYFGKIGKPSEDSADIALCTDNTCGTCSFSVPLDPGLAPYVVDGACLRVVHQGVAVDGDPEAASGCKTTGLAIFDDATVYPLYVASSRVVMAPGFIDADVRLDVERGAGEPCDCAAGDCCLEGQARHLRLAFTDHGEAVGTLAAGEFVTTDLKGATYLLAVVRAHVKGQVNAKTQLCVDDPETPFIDWHMLRVQGP
ncbi:hypothetical protein [Nannocystis radixulma]|uniref:Uncharacterized protein n=1 Tax=Nannocystis radixulma TaxID=2995305 RepID=A0ABT5B2Q2_9BACT|nr:hypothetical protein [Nannocystis radixulma]MDC0667341.1 hypothetical protein [Nannocystis radixulma]